MKTPIHGIGKYVTLLQNLVISKMEEWMQKKKKQQRTWVNKLLSNRVKEEMEIKFPQSVLSHYIRFSFICLSYFRWKKDKRLFKIYTKNLNVQKKEIQITNFKSISFFFLFSLSKTNHLLLYLLFYTFNCEFIKQ